MFQLKKTQWTVTSASYGTVWLRSVSWLAWIRIQGLCKPRHLRYLFFEQLLGGRLLAKIFFALNSQHQIKAIIMHLKYFPVSDWLKPHTVQFTITSCCWPNLEQILSYGTNDVKSAVRCKILNWWRENDVKSAAGCRLSNRWLQNDVKSAARCRLLNWWRQNDVKSAAHCKLLNRRRQNDVKSAGCCRLLNHWPRKPGGKVLLYVILFF